MSGRKFQLHSNMQSLYWILSIVVITSLIIIFLVCLIKGRYDFLIVPGVWLIVLTPIFLKLNMTYEIRFDDDFIYLKKTFTSKRKTSKLEQVKKIKTSTSGYFTTIELFEKGRIEKYSCFNTLTSALKYNRTDVFNLNKPLIDKKHPESDLLALLKEKVSHKVRS